VTSAKPFLSSTLLCYNPSGMAQTKLSETAWLKQQIVKLLKAYNRPVPIEKIGREALYLTNADNVLIGAILQDLLAGDARFIFRSDNTLELAPDTDDSRLLSEAAFVVIDVETTGGHAYRDRITEIGAYRVYRGQIVNEFNTLINPGVPIPYWITALTGIDDRMVAGAPRFSQVADALLDFIGDSIFVAHNAPFDKRFINAELERDRGVCLGNANLCTVSLSRRVVPGLDNYRLHTVADYFNIVIDGRHRAGGDALATARVFIRLLERISFYGVSTVGGARRFRLTQSHNLI